MSDINLPATTTYEVRVYVSTHWATGSLRGTATRTFHVEEASTVLGAARAIDAAVEQCHGRDLCEIHSPDISPNPAELGWPLGFEVTA